MRDQGARELRALSRLFVLEVDEDVPTARRLLLNDARPALDLVRAVALIAKPEIRVVGGDLDGRLQLLAVGDAERQVPRPQPRIDLVVQPRRMPELEGGAHRR